THAGHERAFDYVERALAFLARFLGIAIDVIDDPFDQSVLEPLFHRLAPPCFVFDVDLAFRFDSLDKLNQTLGRLVAAIEQDILDTLPPLWFYLFVNSELPGV